MSRHLQPVDRRSRNLRTVMIAVVWIGGLVAGSYALLSIAVRYGCSATNDALACQSGGSAVGVLLVVTVIAVVTAVTVLAATRPARAVAVLAVGGLLALVLCFGAALWLLRSV